jgi:glyoxylase I family protein
LRFTAERQPQKVNSRKAIIETKIWTAIMSAPDADFLSPGHLSQVHHIALNVADIQAAKHFYGQILGLHELQGTEIPSSIAQLVAAGKVANFRTPDGLILDLFAEPGLTPPNEDPTVQFTRANHLAFNIDPQLFDFAVQVLRSNNVKIEGEPITRSTGRGVYCYDPDGLMIEIRCDPI